MHGRALWAGSNGPGLQPFERQCNAAEFLLDSEEHPSIGRVARRLRMRFAVIMLPSSSAHSESAIAVLCAQVYLSSCSLRPPPKTT
jgi:hypothetical protein